METIIKERAGSYGIIIQNNSIALVRKAKGGYKGKLDLPGGGIEHTETPEEALKREIYEEAGLVVKDYELLDVAGANVKWQMEENLIEDLHQIGALYVINAYENNLKKDADGLDSLGTEWYKIEDLKKNELTPFTIHSLEKLGYSLKN